MRAPLLLSLGAVGLAALAGCTDTAAGPGDTAVSLQTRGALELLPGDARVAGMLDLAAAREAGVSPLADGNPGMAGLDGEGAARLAEFVRLTGFDPERDIERVYVAVSGAPSSGDAAPALVVYATFERARLEAYLDGQTDELRRTTHRGVNVYVADDEGGAFALAAPGEDYLVAGDEAAVRAMLDRAADGGTAGSLAADAGALALIRRAAFPEDAWFVARGVAAEAPDGPAPADAPAGAAAFAQAGGLVDDVVFSADFSRDDVAFTAVGLTSAGADAGDVADLVRGGVSAARAGAADPAELAVLDGVRVREVAGGVEVRGTVPASRIAALHAH